MTKTITVSEVIPAAAADIYAAWLDSVAHAAMTGGGKADASPEVGAPYSAWDGYINGLNLALNPGERIEQSWRSTDFNPGDADSTLTVLLEPSDQGTKVTFVHSGVPDQLADFADGWRQYYFEPMKSYFAALLEPPMAAMPKAKPVAEAPAPKKTAARKSAATKKAAARKPAAVKPAAGKKTAGKKAVAKKSAAKKPAARKAAAKKPVARKAATKKPAARKTAAKKSPARKAATGARKTATRKGAKKAGSRKTVARKPAAKKPMRKGRR